MTPRRLIPALLLAAACNASECPEWNAAFARMENQPRAQPFGRNVLFEDERAMRPVPADTVARDEAIGAEPRPRFDAPLLARGQERFDAFCAVCHGLTGTGDSRVATNMSLRPPPSLHSERVLALSDEALHDVVSNGYGLMPSYSLQLPARDRWAVVAYVRALQRSRSVPIVALPPAMQQEARNALP